MFSVPALYAAFFLASLSVLFLILCVKMPELWRSCRRFFRQLAARRTRKGRMLADLERLMTEARRLEGLYCFESVEAHASPAISRSGRGSSAKSSASPLQEAVAAR